MHPPASDYIKVIQQSFQDFNDATITFWIFYEGNILRLYSQIDATECTINALRQVHSPHPVSSGSQTARGSHALPAWRPPRQLRIQDNRFREYQMKSLQRISIFYQPSRRHAENNPDKQHERTCEVFAKVWDKIEVLQVEVKIKLCCLFLLLQQQAGWAHCC